MDIEIMNERLNKLFDNNPTGNLDKLPDELAKVIGDKIRERALAFNTIGELVGNTEAGVYGAAGQAFFAGHNYAVEYGNLMAEMKEVA